MFYQQERKIFNLGEYLILYLYIKFIKLVVQKCQHEIQIIFFSKIINIKYKEILYSMAFSENSVIKISELRDAIYPIGSVYLSVSNVSPQTFFGGTWIALEEGRTLWTANPSKDDSGNTISEGTNNLSDNESTWKIEAGLPNIKGNLQFRHMSYNTVLNADGKLFTKKYINGDYSYASSTGSGNGTDWVYLNANTYNSIYSDNVHTVQPPSLRIYAWRRTA